MPVQKRVFYSFAAIVVFLLTVFIFYTSSIRILDKIIQSRIQVDDLYDKWFLCKYEIFSALFKKGRVGKFNNLHAKINDLDRALNDYKKIFLFSPRGRADPEISNLILKLRVEWSASRIIFFKELAYLNQYDNITIDQANKVYSELSASSYPFEIVFKSVRSWMDNYYKEQLKSFRLLFILLGLILILSSVFILAATNLNMLQERLFLTALNALSDGVILTDARKRVMFINSGAERLFNIKSERVKNEAVEKIVTLKDEFSNQPVLMDEIGGSIPPGSIVLVNSSEKKIPVSISFAPLLSRRDIHLGYAYLIKDITQWKRLVTKISSEFVTLEDVEVDNEIEEILKRILEAVEGDSAYVFQFEMNVDNIIVTHMWENGSAKGRGARKRIKLDKYQDFMRLLSSKKFIKYKELTDKDFLVQYGYSGTFIVPIIYTGVLIGFILVASRKDTNLSDSARLSILTMKDMIVNLLERKWVAKELAFVGSEMNTLIEDANAPIWGVDRDGLIIIWNRKMEEISGYDKGLSFKSNFTDYLADDDSKSFFYRILENAHNGKTDIDCEVRLKTASGLESVILFNTTLQRNSDGVYQGIIFVGQDITKRKLSEIEIHKLTQQLIQVQDEEQKRVSMELHDNIAQELLTIRFSLENFVRDNEKVKGIRGIKKLSSRVGALIEATRNLSYNLYPSYLEQFGFNKAVETFCSDFSNRYGVTVEYIASGFNRVIIKAETAIHLYRVIQEAFANIHRHSHADRAVLRIVVSYPSVIIRIEDNGCGFNIDNVLQGNMDNVDTHMGLRNMKERVTLLDGNIDIVSKPGKGTKIRIEIPLEEQ